ncbi:MAG: DUF4352 domain-containing protein [Clostridia bacterium]|nr:DUF4352 domain-containing protein [Clostridia bacterium]
MKRVATIFAAFILLLSFAVAPAENEVYRLNEPVTTKSGTVITLLSVKESKGSYYFSPESGNVFLIAEFLVENNSKKEINVSTLMDFDAYADDFALDYSFNALLACDNSLDVTIKAGKKAKGQVGFEVDSKWRVLEIEYTPEFWGSESYTFIYEKYGSNISVKSGSSDHVVYIQPGTNVRKEPSSSSAVAGFVEYGGNFNYYEVTQGWYKIMLNDGSFGYVYQSRCNVIS